MNLATQHLTVGERLEHTRYQQLREFDHRPEYVDVRVVPSESADHAYLVARVSTLPEPFHADMDVSEAREEVYLCSCPQFHFRCSGGFEDGENPPEEWDECKHIMANP